MHGLSVVTVMLAAALAGGWNGRVEESTPGDSTDGGVTAVRIGAQIWMAANLDVTVDSAGQPIESMAYNGDRSLISTYGLLYTQAEALRACPRGWHLPSMAEWEALFAHLGGIEVAGGKLKAATGWDPPNVGGSNSSGFSALPAGGCVSSRQCDGLGWATHFWSSTSDGKSAKMPSLMNKIENAYVLSLSPSLTASVRCLRD